jgi:hypothetical protein
MSTHVFPAHARHVTRVGRHLPTHPAPRGTYPHLPTYLRRPVPLPTYPPEPGGGFQPWGRRWARHRRCPTPRRAAAARAPRRTHAQHARTGTARTHSRHGNGVTRRFHAETVSSEGYQLIQSSKQTPRTKTCEPGTTAQAKRHAVDVSKMRQRCANDASGVVEQLGN